MNKTNLLFVAMALAFLLNACETSKRQLVAEPKTDEVLCQTNDNCETGQICNNGICIDNGGTSPTDCNYSSECAADMVCMDGACVVVSCKTDADCNKGRVCNKNGMCIDDAEENEKEEKANDDVKNSGMVIFANDIVKNITCGSEIKGKSITANCSSNSCVGWTFDPPLPDGMSSTSKGESVELSGALSIEYCAKNKEFVTTVTACDTAFPEICSTKDVKLNLVLPKLKVKTVQPEAQFAWVLMNVKLEAEDGSGDYSWTGVSHKVVKPDSTEGSVTAGLPTGINIVNGALIGTVKEPAFYRLTLKAKDNVTEQEAEGELELKVLQFNGFEVRLMIENNDTATPAPAKKNNEHHSSFVYQDVPVPYGATLKIQTVSSSSSTYLFEVVKGAVTVDGNGKITLASPDNNEAEGIEIKVTNGAGQSETLKIDNLIFKKDPCDIKIIEKGPTPPKQLHLGEEMSGSWYGIEGGDEGAEYIWWTTREAGAHNAFGAHYDLKNNEVEHYKLPSNTIYCRTSKFNDNFDANFLTLNKADSSNPCNLSESIDPGSIEDEDIKKELVDLRCPTNTEISTKNGEETVVIASQENEDGPTYPAFVENDDSEGIFEEYGIYNVGEKCRISGHALFKFKKELSDHFANAKKDLTITDNITIHARPADPAVICSNLPTKNISYNVTVPHPLTTGHYSNMLANVKLATFDTDGDEWFLVQIKGKEDKVLGETKDVKAKSGIVSADAAVLMAMGAVPIFPINLVYITMAVAVFESKDWTWVTSSLAMYEFTDKVNYLKLANKPLKDINAIKILLKDPNNNAYDPDYDIQYIILVTPYYYLYVLEGCDKVGEMEPTAKNSWTIGKEACKGRGEIKWKLRCDPLEDMGKEEGCDDVAAIDSDSDHDGE